MKTYILAKTVTAMALAVLVPAARESSAQELSTEDVVERCVEALGGHEPWQALRSLEISGSQSSYSKIGPVRIRWRSPDHYRSDHHEGGYPITVAYDGELAWWKRQWRVATRGNWAVEAPEPYTLAIETDAELVSPFLTYRRQGHTLEYLGEGDLDGEPLHEVKVSRGNGLTEQWFLDLETFVPVARISTGFYVGMALEQRTYFDDYRMVAGVLLPYFLEIELANDYRALTIEEVKANVDFDPTIFALPLPDGMEELRHLEGSWDVKVETPPPPNTPVPQVEETMTTSVIRSRSRGSLLEEQVSFKAAGFTSNVIRSFTYDRFKKHFRISYLDNATAHLDVLQGALEDGRLVVSNLETDTHWSVHEEVYHTRETVYEMTDRSFKLDREISANGGQDWLLSHRFTYTRTEPESPDS